MCVRTCVCVCVLARARVWGGAGAGQEAGYGEAAPGVEGIGAALQGALRGEFDSDAAAIKRSATRPSRGLPTRARALSPVASESVHRVRVSPVARPSQRPG